MNTFTIQPTICSYATAKEFAAAFDIAEDDLMILSERTYRSYFEPLKLSCDTLFQNHYGTGEPTDDMFERMYSDVKKHYKRIIGIGGGTILDLAKFFALENASPIFDLYDGSIPPVKDKDLILVPTTCGTGSEVTNISILALTKQNSKKGLALSEMYADHAVLIPELLSSLPMYPFSTSSIDALVHAVESYLSPNSNSYTSMYSLEAIRILLSGYQIIVEKGPEARIPLLEDFLIASNYAGIAFGNAGCAAVHALSYPLGAVYHVAHGESNYAMFTGVMKNYMELKQDGKIAALNRYLADLLHCDVTDVYEELEQLLNHLIPKKPLHEYGMTKEDIDIFTDSVIENQQRLLKNNFVPFDRDRIQKIYTELY